MPFLKASGEHETKFHNSIMSFKPKETNRMSENAIKIENLSKKYEDKNAVENLSLEVFKGNFLGY